MGKPKTRGNGEGTIFKRKINGKDKWVMEYTFNMQDEKTGKRKRKTLYGNTRKEVKEKLEKLLTEINTDTYVDKSKITFYDIAKEYIKKSYNLNQLRASSYDRKLITLNQILKHFIGNMELQKITEEDLKDFFIYITKYSNSTISKIYGLTYNTFKIAVRKKILSYNFLDDNLEFPKPISNKRDKNILSFTIKEQQKFINAISKNNFPYKYQLLLSLFTGMRMGEINALYIDDIDMKNKIIHVKRTITRTIDRRATIGIYTKTRSGIRDIIMNKQVESILKKYLSTDYIKNDLNLLFCNSKKDCICTDTVNVIFKNICKKYNIGKGYNMNQHMLRHTFATRCIEAGMPPNVLSKIMGHANVSTTLNIYCNVFDKYQKKYSNSAYSYLKKNSLTIDF